MKSLFITILFLAQIMSVSALAESTCTLGATLKQLAESSWQYKNDAYYGLGICRQALKDGKLGSNPHRFKVYQVRTEASYSGDGARYFVRMAFGETNPTLVECSGTTRYDDTGPWKKQDGYNIQWCSML